MSAHDVSEGGLAMCLAECVSEPLGAEIEIACSALALFSEPPSRIVISVAPANADAVARSAEKIGVLTIGRVTARPYLRVHGVEVETAAIRAARESCLDALVRS